MKSSTSYWIASTEETDYSPLKEDLTVDITIVGGGIVGITSAYLLQKAGLDIAILEGNKIITGTTGYTTAKITSQHSLIYEYLVNTFGHERAQIYGDANEKALSFIINMVEKNNISCDLDILPTYVYTLDEKCVANIEREVETRQRLGLNGQYSSDCPLALPVKAAIQIEEQAQFHPRKYLLALARKFVKSGGQIYENSRIVDVTRGSKITLTTEDEIKIKTDKVILASHFPIYDGWGLYFTRLIAESSYALGVTTKEKFSQGMFISAENPRRTLRNQKFDDGELIIIGGENHRTGHGQDVQVHYQALKDFTQDLFTLDELHYQWNNQDYTTLDRVPYIGRLTPSQEQIYVATGFGKWGMTNGTNAALLLKDLIIKGSSPYEQLFNPSRHITTSSVKNFIIETLDTSKHLVKGKIKGGEKNVILDNGEGQLVEIEGKKYGAYKDTEGKLHIVDSTCTHLRCELSWNSVAKTWDCPCHGSRFDFRGKIIDGPALKPLPYFQGEPEPTLFD